MNRRLTYLAAGLAVAVAASVVGWLGVNPDASAENGRSASKSPELVVKGNFPDPDMAKFGDTYYGYATNTGGKNVPVAKSDKPGGTWNKLKKDALPKLGSWAKEGLTWAPDVSKRPDGSYTLYYTAREKKHDIQCIGAARATKPEGPFKPVGKNPIVCPTSRAGAIDASTFTEGDKNYLLYKTDDNAIGKPTSLMLQRTNADGTKLKGKPFEMLRNDRESERGIIEAPVLTKRGDTYVLVYAGGQYGNDSYFTGYATSSSLSKKFAKAKRSVMTSATTGMSGPGGADIVPGSDGTDHIYFHAHTGDKQRSTFRADLGWAGTRPVVGGNWTRFEAESGKVHDAKVRSGAKNASNGKVVGKIDHNGSYVDIKVFVPRSGKHTAMVGYANGSKTTASHKLSVNGGKATTVSYDKTGWDNWKKAKVSVDLKAGWNTLRFQNGKAYAELDFLDVR